jgi:hypothetical protein
VDFLPFNNSEGLINMIYIVSCKCGQEFVLRVANPHPLMRRYFTLTHANIIKKLKQETSIPLPEVLRYDETTENAIKSEYIIFKKLKGTTLT